MRKFISFLTSFVICLLCFGSITVYADGEYISYNTDSSISVYFPINSSNNQYSNISVNTSQSSVSSGEFHYLFYRTSENSGYTPLIWCYADDWASKPSIYLYTGSTASILSFRLSLNFSEYTSQVENTEGVNRTIYYNPSLNNATYYWAFGISDGSYDYNSYFDSRYPRITLGNGQSYRDILDVISTGFDSYPWYGTTSGGGRYFQDGTSLTPEQNAQYEQIYIVMDSNHDNVVTQQELNTYNETYNTNYDYTTINNGSDFDELQFLNYIAILISNGDDNPGGGTGSGGSPDASGGNVTITESFHQQQQQTIEENAVNVTVNNNNEVSQENVNLINQIVNDISGEDRNAFNQSVSAVTWASEYIGNFSSLVSAVLGFLPSWITSILSIIFGMMLLCIVLRLLHLFV